MLILTRYTTHRYQFLKDVKRGVYFIRRKKDLKTVKIGNKDVAENYILYGLTEMKEEVNELFKK